MARPDPHPERRPAVVTGASSGIGTAIARQLAALGHPVVLGARRADRLDELAAAIAADGGEAVALTLDVTDEASVAAFAAAAVDAVGEVEVVVSNAGDVRPIDAVGEPAEFERQLQVNLLGPQRLVHHLVPPMVARGRGDVVFVTSEVALQARPHMAAYVASKAGLEGLANGMRMELEASGVRVGIVRPGPTLTEQGSTWSGDEITRALDAWRHWGLVRHAGYLRPDQVAAGVVAMVSAPRGGQLAVVEVQPEAPLRDPEASR